MTLFSSGAKKAHYFKPVSDVVKAHYFKPVSDVVNLNEEESPTYSSLVCE